MKTYTLEGGETILAATPKEFVSKLRRSSLFESDVPDAVYMREFACRYQVQTGNIVRIDTAESFIMDLRTFKYIS